MTRRDLIRTSFLTALAMPLVDVSQSQKVPARAIEEVPIVPNHNITYDVAGMPDGMSIEQIMYYAKNYGIILWDATKRAQKPSFTGEITESTVEIDPFVK